MDQDALINRARWAGNTNCPDQIRNNVQYCTAIARRTRERETKKKSSKYCIAVQAVQKFSSSPNFDIHLEVRGVYEGRRLTTREKCFAERS
jgi:hypothetical protein